MTYGESLSALPAAANSTPVFEEAKLPKLPDVARDNLAKIRGTLHRVGMSGIETVVQLAGADGVITRSPARADAFVSLDDPNAKGIHMSRLFLALDEELAQQTLDVPLLEKLATVFQESHESLSDSAYLQISFEHLERRPALLTKNAGWRTYPVAVSVLRSENSTRYWITVRITYSSACPCSAALSRQALSQSFQEAFGRRAWMSPAQVVDWIQNPDTVYPVPHSQRSHADVTVELADPVVDLPWAELIDKMEAGLGTAVQTAVKREDEQQFAVLNGENLMFCEDAARRLKQTLEEILSVSDYRIEVSHLESLHPHDAVAIVAKGVEGGLRA